MQIRQNGAGLTRTTLRLGTACMVLALAGSLAIPNRYISDAVVNVGDADRASVALIVRQAFTPERLQSLIDKHHLYAAASVPTQSGDAIARMRHDIRVSPMKESNGKALEVSFQYSNPAVAQQVTADLIDTIFKEHVISKSRGTFSVVDPAGKSEDPVFPNRKIIACIGFAGGALIGLVWMLLIRRNTDSLSLP